MRVLRSTTLALLTLALMGPKADAQFGYSIDQFQQTYSEFPGGFQAGFIATVLIQNVNTYADPDIVFFRSLITHVSPRIRELCDVYNLSRDGCVLSNRGFGYHGNVQTGNIPVGDSYWIHNPMFSGDTCLHFCPDYLVRIDNRGVLGCQAPFPSFPSMYWARTCDEDGYDGAVSMTMRFSYSTSDPGIPVLAFSESDLYLTATNYVDTSGPNAFVHVTPEPESGLLVLTGVALLGATVGRMRLPTKKRTPQGVR